MVGSFTSEEILEAINRTGKKGLAWDCITVWVVKLISNLTVMELMKVSKEVEVNLEGVNLNWIQDGRIKELEEEDEEITKYTVGNEGEKGSLEWMPKEIKSIMKASLSTKAICRGTTKTGMFIIKELLANALRNEDTICGRLYLL